MPQSIPAVPPILRRMLLFLAACVLSLPSLATAVTCEEVQVVEDQVLRMVQPETGFFSVGSRSFEMDVYVTDNETEYRDLDGNAVRLDYFAPGMTVRISYCSDVNIERPEDKITPGLPPVALKGTAVLLEETGVAPTVTPTPSVTPIPGEVRVEGPIQELTAEPPSIRVRELLFNIDESTTIEDKEGNDLSLDDLAEGDRVFVVAVPVFGEDTTVRPKLLARKIVLLQTVPPPLSEVDGVITAIDAANTSFLIARTSSAAAETTGPVNIIVSTTTIIKSSDGDRLTFDDLQVGDGVHVRGEWLATIQVIGVPPAMAAHSIVVREDNPNVTIEGRVVEIDSAAGGFVLEQSNRRVVVHVTRSTNFISEAGQPLAFSDLQKGRKVKVEGLWLDTDSSTKSVVPQFEASTVVIFGPQFDEITGMITSIDAGLYSFMLLDDRIMNPGDELDTGNAPLPVGINVLTSNTTKFIDEDGDEVRFNYLAVGQIVSVRGTHLPTFAPPSAFQAEVVAVKKNVEPPTAEIVGRVNRINAEMKALIVNDISVATTTGTMIYGENGEQIRFEDIEVGNWAKVKGRWIAPTGFNLPPVLIAAEIHIRAFNDYYEFDGVIEEITWERSSFSTGDHTVVVTRSTNIFDADGKRLEFSNLRVGMEVHVVGELSPLDIWPPIVTAKTIRVLDDPNPEPVEVEGKITDLRFIDRTNDETKDRDGHHHDEPPVTNAGLLVMTVEDVHMILTRDTRIVDVDGVEIPANALRVGDFVHAIAIHSDELNHLVAIRVKVLESEPPVEPVTFKGIVESIDYERGNLVVRGRMVHATTETLVLAENGDPLTLENIASGDRVEVKGLLVSNNTVLARQIVLLEDDSHQGQEVEFRGIIAEIDLEARTLIVSGKLVIVPEGIVILDIDNNLIELDGLNVGELVEVEGRVQFFAETDGPGAVEASKVEVEKTGCIEQHVSGEIAEMLGDIWVIRERQVRVTEDTKFSDREGNNLSAADFAVGDRVKVHGCAAPGSALIARDIVLLRNAPSPPACEVTVAFGGPVEEVDTATSQLIVAGRTVTVEVFTHISREGKGPIGLDEIQVGDEAFVEAMALASHRELIACQIRIKSSEPPVPPEEHRVIGRIAAISTPTMTLEVRDVTIQVTSDTKIKTRSNHDLNFEDLAMGQLVDARGRLDADGVLVAAMIRVQEENQLPRPPKFIAGPITELSIPAALTIGDQAVALTNETEIVSLDGAPAQPEDLQVGDYVRAALEWPEAIAGATTTIPLAKRITIKATMIQEINYTSGTLLVSGHTIAVHESTVIRDFGIGDIQFEDLVVGDLVHVRVSPLTVYPPQATVIVRFSSVTFSEGIDGYGPVEAIIRHGKPGIRGTHHGNSFGFMDLPVEMADAVANRLYEIRARISTNVEDPTRVPTMRLRMNMANFEKGTTFEITGNGPGHHTATPEGREYRCYFVPTADNENLTEEARQFFASLDLLNFDDRLAEDGELRLDSIRVLPIDLTKVEVLRSLLLDEFANGAGDWTYGSAPEAFTAARYGEEPGAISLAPNGESESFGFWTLDTGVTIEAGKVYRARFLVHTNTSNAAGVPSFRLRLNTSTFQLASTVSVAPVGTLEEMATPEARVYDVYIPIPKNASGDETLLASIDLIGFSEGLNPDATVTLEQFRLEEVSVPPAE